MNTSSYPIYYHPYIEKIPADKDAIDLLIIGLKELIKTLAMVSEDKANLAYAESKWTIKELVQHLIDSERIFCYRALCIARGEKGKLPGYDHDEYVTFSDANRRSLKSLLEEYKINREGTIQLFKSFNSEMKERVGNANGVNIQVHQILFIIIGHEIHHRQILEERYL